MGSCLVSGAATIPAIVVSRSSLPKPQILGLQRILSCATRTSLKHSRTSKTSSTARQRQTWCSVALRVSLSSSPITTWSAPMPATRGHACFLWSMASGLPLRYRETTSQTRWTRQRGLGDAMVGSSSLGSSRVWLFLDCELRQGCSTALSEYGSKTNKCQVWLWRDQSGTWQPQVWEWQRVQRSQCSPTSLQMIKF